MSAWPDILVGHATSELTARRLIVQLRACEASALAFCRLLERWGRGEALPATAGGREAALRHAADRVETALAGLEVPLGRYLLELEADQAEGRSWYSGPGAGELVEWQPVLTRAGVQASPHRVTAVYLELAVLVRALQGLSDSARLDAPPDASSLWAGLFDLRDTLLGSHRGRPASACRLASPSSAASTSTSSRGSSGCRGRERPSPTRASPGSRAARARTRPSPPRASGPT